MRATGWLQDFVRVHESQLRPNEVPKAYLDAKISGVDNERFTRVAKHYLSKFWELAEAGKAPAFFGRAGSYKTYTASAIALTIRQSALIDVAFVQCAVELQELERRRFDPNTNQRIDWLGTAPFVVLDDITKARANSFAMDMLDAILERRYADGLPTLFTGNAVIRKDDDSAIVDQFGVGFARRLGEMSQGLTVVSK